jgi:hypothetical protein
VFEEIGAVAVQIVVMNLVPQVVIQPQHVVHEHRVFSTVLKRDLENSGFLRGVSVEEQPLIFLGLAEALFKGNQFFRQPLQRFLLRKQHRHYHGFENYGLSGVASG